MSQPSSAPDLARVRALQETEQGLAVVSTTRADGSVTSTVVNTGLLDHPLDDRRVVGWVSRGDARKLDHLRARPRATVCYRRSWQWVAVEGAVDLAGPDDELPGLDRGRLPGLLRAIFRAAGGTHDDWDTYDRVMREERRVAVLLNPTRVYSNPGR